MSTPPLGPIDSGIQPALPVGTPYCSNCGYDLSATTESPRCPECGLPLVEVLTRVVARSLPGAGRTRRYSSTATVWGMPFLSIATGPRLEAGERYGHARGFIAFGDMATGVIAVGGRAVGVFSFGGFSMGVFSLGGCSIGGLLSAGGCAVAIPGVASGGLGIGGFATGGMGLGVVAQGGFAVGVFAKGGAVIAPYAIAGGRADPQAVAVFDALHFLAPSFGSPIASAYMPIIIVFAAVVALGLLTLSLGVFVKKEPGDAGFR